MWRYLPFLLMSHQSFLILGEEWDSAVVCGEFYISTLYCRLLLDGAPMVARRVDRDAMVGLGTPKQVKEYEGKAL